jgi:hypothetical protein
MAAEWGSHSPHKCPPEGELRGPPQGASFGNAATPRELSLLKHWHMFFVIMGKKRRNKGKAFQKTKLSPVEQAFCFPKCTTFQWRKISVQGGTPQIH